MRQEMAVQDGRGRAGQAGRATEDGQRRAGRAGRALPVGVEIYVDRGTPNVFAKWWDGLVSIAPGLLQSGMK